MAVGDVIVRFPVLTLFLIACGDSKDTGTQDKPSEPSTDEDRQEGTEAGDCDDDADNDGDGLFDCDDEGCEGSDVCESEPSDEVLGWRGI